MTINKKIVFKVLLLTLAVVMTVVMLHETGTNVRAAAGDPAINLAGGSASNIQGAQASSIWFGNYDQSNIPTAGFDHEPIKWRVLHNGNGRFLLLSDKNLDCRKYNETKTGVTWETSTIRSWLNEDFKRTALSTGEEGAVKTEAQDKLFLLSTEESMNADYGFTANTNKTDKRSAKNTDYADFNGAWTSSAGNGMWWLRSPGNNNTKAALVDHDGTISTFGEDVDNPRPQGQMVAVRPALNIDQSQVVFTSANGAKTSGAVGETALTQVGTNASDEWKLTVKDDAHKNFKVTKVTQAVRGFFYAYGVHVTYTGAQVGANEYISAVITDRPITDKDAKIKYYGRIKNCTNSEDASGTITIDYDEKMGENDYLYVLNERLNDDHKTDYSSALCDARVSVMRFMTNISWENDGDEQANRPEKVVVHLMAGETEVETKEVRADDTGHWDFIIPELPIYDSNWNRISYSVKTDEIVNKYGRRYTTEVRNILGLDFILDIKATLSAKSKLTITAKDQTFPYNGENQGPADTVYEDPAEIAENVTVTGLTDDDSLSSIILDGQGKEEGEYEITPSGARIGDFDASNKYAITYVPGKLTITHVCRGFKKIEKVAPTCTEAGTEEYWECGICSKIYSDGEGKNELDAPVKIDALGHKYGAWKELSDSQHQRVCEHDAAHVEKENHSWDAGKVTKAATEQAEGVKTFTCTVCKAEKTESIPTLDPEPEPKPEPEPDPEPTPSEVRDTLILKMTAKGNTGLVMSWNKIKGAAGYDIFFARCGHGNKKTAARKVKTIKGSKKLKWTKSGLKKGTTYKAYVKAYVKRNGKKTYVSKSPVAHAYTGNGTRIYTNASSVSVNKTILNLNKGKSFKIKAKVKNVKKNRKLMPKAHVSAVRYKTSDSKVAKVTNSGKITAKEKGICYIYAFAHNGVSKKVKVTVK